MFIQKVASTFWHDALEHDDFSFAQVHALSFCFVAQFSQKVHHAFWIAL
jgi:hypothetical protein